MSVVSSLDTLVKCKPTVMTTVMISGGCDPLHSGHLAYIRGAAQLADTLVIVVNSDNFLLNKKGYYVLPLEERVAIVDAAAHAFSSDILTLGYDSDSDNVSEVIRKFRPTVFANGGDRSTFASLHPEEIAACSEVGTVLAVGVGSHHKQAASSNFFEKAVERYRQYQHKLMSETASKY